MDIKHRVIVTQTHLQRYQQYHVFLFCIWCFHCFFFPVYAVVKKTHAFHTIQRPCYEIRVKCFFLRHNDVMTSTGIEPATFQLLAQCSNHLRYATVEEELQAAWAANNCPTLLQDPKGYSTFHSGHCKSENSDHASKRI